MCSLHRDVPLGGSCSHLHFLELIMFTCCFLNIGITVIVAFPMDF